MKIFNKISLPIIIAVLVADLFSMILAQGYLERSLFNEVYIGHKDDAVRTARALLDRAVFLNPYTDDAQYRLQRYIESLRSGDVVRITVWSTDGMVLTSDLSQIIGDQARRHPELLTVLDTKAPLFLKKQIDNNDPVQSSISPVRLVLIPLFFEGRFSGVVEIHLTNAIIGSLIQRSTYLLGTFILFMGLLCLLAMVVVVRRVIVEPIQEMTVAAEKIAAGDWDVAIQKKANDEVGVLTMVFMRMRNQLKKNIQSITHERMTAEKAEHLEYLANQKMALEKEELKKFKQATDNSFDSVVITDPDGHILYANKTAEQLTGFTQEEMLGKTPALWGKQMSQAFYKKFWQTIKTEKKPYVGEITNKRKNGEIYIASAHVSPILNDRGEVSFFVGVEQDITEQRKREEQKQKHLLELEALNQKITSEKVRAEGILRYLRAIGEGVYATDLKGMIVFCNPAAAAMVGRTPESVIGEESQSVFRFCTSTDDTQCDLLPYREGLTTRQTFTFPSQAFLQGKSGQIPVAGTAAPIIEIDHKAGAIIVFQDRTSQYELEQMKDNFLSVAAHQLRTPLGSMRWSMELLLNGDFGKLPKTAHEALEQLYENSQRMIVLVRDLLNVSRIGQKQGEEVKESTNIRSLWLKVIETLQGEAEKRTVRLVLKGAKKLPLVMVPPRRFYEAFENLLSNAIKYNKINGKVSIELRESEGNILITVTDTGIGIPKDAQSKLFSKFYRAKNAILKETEGSGLGLSVVKSYIEEVGGSISFESKENIGTTFTVLVPIHEERGDKIIAKGKKRSKKAKIIQGK